jgi:hypothetical protein
MKRPRTRTLILGGIAVVLLGGAGGFTLWLNATPPALGAHPADVYRLVAEGGTHGIAPQPSVTVPLPAGRNAYLTLDGRDSADPDGVNSIAISTNRESNADASAYKVRSGTHIRTHGLDITVLHVWNEPLSKNDAIDLKAVPAR